MAAAAALWVHYVVRVLTWNRQGPLGEVPACARRPVCDGGKGERGEEGNERRDTEGEEKAVDWVQSVPWWSNAAPSASSVGGGLEWGNGGEVAHTACAAPPGPGKGGGLPDMGA